MKPLALPVALLLAACLTACGVFPSPPQSQQPVVDACPPLPRLPKNATRHESRVWTMTIIALYAQCAESKK